MDVPRSRAKRAELRTLHQVRVAVLSDDRLFSEGLLRMLVADQSFLVIGNDDATGLPRALRVPRTDVLLLDSRMKGALGLCTAFSSDNGPSVILVAAPDDDAWATQALQAGARGILSHNARPDQMVSAIRSVSDGLIWARRRVLAARIDQLSGVKQSAESVLERRLSMRETEVLRHAATGLCNKELANRLAISQATVKVHLTHIFQKLGVQSRAELAAAYHGIISAPHTT